jgi:hypothetical protein
MPREPHHVPNSLDIEIETKIWGRKSRASTPDGADRFKLEPAANYDGLVVFDFADSTLFGGGTVHAPDFLRVLIQLRLGPCKRLCDFCCGVGYIGFSLLARNFCSTLCCVDLNPKYIEAVETSATFNAITDRVSTYVSDGLNQVPDNERWDLVVCNPPQLLPRVTTDSDTAVTFDPEWRLHRNFYSKLKPHMTAGGHAVVMGARYETSAKTFEPIISEGGGRIIAELPAKDYRGREDDRYFLVTQW